MDHMQVREFFVGHRMTDRPFTDVAFDDRIKLETNENLPLPGAWSRLQEPRLRPKLDNKLN